MFPKLTHITPILPILPILAALTIGALGAEKLGDMNWFYFGPVPEGRQWCQLLAPEKAASSGSGSGRLDLLPGPCFTGYGFLSGVLTTWVFRILYLAGN